MGGGQSQEGAGAAGGTPALAKGKSATGYHILLHVYEPTEQQMSMPGFGVYHSGVEIAGTEYTFAGGPGQSGTGVMSHRPKAAPPGSPWKYKQTEDLGPLQMDRAKLTSVLDNLKREFPAKDYDLMAKNCNHFTEAFVTALGATFPSWVNRAAKVGNNFRGMMGQGQAPPAAKPVEPVKSVFESSQGHSLVASDKPAAGTKPIAASGTTAGGKSERFNPWRDPNFMPGSKNKLTPSTSPASQ
eukprot:gb/GEZN01013529.1/.p1 GENE.gb/GEZN01013529.1/~~gb/GEZN01013529.1/.p1  ORF type:complete len:261 (+),score=51.86 gb/GEZN01013529.1/:58-783(+)